MLHKAEDAATVKVVGGYLLLVASISWFPPASLWWPPSPPCAVWSMHAMLSHSE